MIIDVMNGKAGERKVGNDGVKDRSLGGRQKKGQCHEEEISSFFLQFMALERHRSL